MPRWNVLCSKVCGSKKAGWFLVDLARIGTEDLIVANSHPCSRRRDTEEVRIRRVCGVGGGVEMDDKIEA